MKKGKTKKLVALLAVLALATTLIPVAVFAANTVEIQAAIDSEADPTVTVTGSISGAGDVTLLAIKSAESLNGVIPASVDSSAIMYIDQQTVANNDFEIAFKLRETNVVGDYLTVFVGGTDVAQYASAEIVLAAAPAVSEDAITFANWEGEVYEDVYGIDGAVIVEIAAEDVDVDPDTQTIYVDDVALYYSPEREMFVGVVVDYDDEAAVAADITVADEASECIYYGYIDDPFHEDWEEGDTVGLSDLMRMVRIYNNNEAGMEIADYLVADVEQDGEIGLSDLMLIVQAYNGTINGFEF